MPRLRERKYHAENDQQDAEPNSERSKGIPRLNFHRIVPVLQIVPVLIEECRLLAQRNEDRRGLLDLAGERVELAAQAVERRTVRRIRLRHERITACRQG